MADRTNHRAAYVTAALLFACSTGDNGATSGNVREAKSHLTRSESPSDANVKALGASNRTFAFDLLHAVAKQQDGANVLVSPYSVSTALAMAYAGARAQTESAMKGVLHFDLEQPALHEAFNATDLALTARGNSADGASGTPFQLHVDNSLWAQGGLPVLSPFLDTLAVNYGAGVYTVDFAGDPEGARKAINQWVAARTEKRIPELLLPGIVRDTTRLVLTNTIYFEASWQTAFKPENTKEGPFTKLDGTQVSIPMMQGLMESASYGATDDYEAVVLPYTSAGLSLVAVMPRKGMFADVDAAANAAWFDQVVASTSTLGVDLTFPKLSYDTHVSLVDALKSLGMSAAFSDSDFSGITDPSLQLENVVHQANIDVTETGTVAAAATAVIFGRKSALMATATAVFERPFLFAIYDSLTGNVLFLGRVLDPSPA